MYELVQVGEKSYYIECPAKIGIYRQAEKDVFLIDSGNDKDAGKKVRKILDEQGWNLKGILNTHSNADHIGGNAYLQRQYECRIFAGGIEKAFTEYPVLEPSFLYGGYPFKELRHKFLMAKPSLVQEFGSEGFPEEVEVIDLPGHFFDMTGFRTPDGTVFLADCLSSVASLEKYQISVLYDAAAYLETLDKVERMEANIFVPSHAQAAEDIVPLVRLNREKVFENAQEIRDICKEPVSFETILQSIFERLELEMNYEQYVLVGSTVRSYLAWMKDQGQVEGFFEKNMLLWKSVG